MRVYGMDLIMTKRTVYKASQFLQLFPDGRMNSVHSAIMIGTKVFAVVLAARHLRTGQLFR